MNTDLTVHMIGNAHLDPVWLWHWQRGSDEALATCRSACDLLDDYPEVVFTRGEAWAYDQVRSLDPQLFKRIRAHVAAGRWEATGGWWVQADTNLPTEDALRKSIELGHAWFREHMGIDRIPVAYLVDSFGHGPYLPRILREAGQEYFVFMRASECEQSLPSSLFRWQSPDGQEVLAFRIIASYLTFQPDPTHHVQEAVDNAPDGIGHVMCFYGVGNHGGGPTRAAVEWIRAHCDFAPGVRLEFSSPSRFFQSVKDRRDACPKVEGELGPHAIGCYSVCGELKRKMRAAELSAADTERMLAQTRPDDLDEKQQELRSAWRNICFNQFHDVITGSSIRDAIAIAQGQIGEAQAHADRVAHVLLRKHLPQTSENRMRGQRIRVVNRSPRPWKGLADCEVWFDWQKWDHHLEDPDGNVVPCQKLYPASGTVSGLADAIPRLIFPVELGVNESRTLRIVPGCAESFSPAGTDPHFDGGILENGLLRVAFGKWGIGQVSFQAGECFTDLLAEPLAFQVMQDQSDTWSHGLERFRGPVLGNALFDAPVLVESGPLQTLISMAGQVGNSLVRLLVSVQRGEPVLYLTLVTNYAEPMSILKACLAPNGNYATRHDRVCGGWVKRTPCGREHVLHHALRLDHDTVPIGLVLPDSFAVDGLPGCIRPTLIRNSLHATTNFGKTDPSLYPGLAHRHGTDDGPQTIRLALAAGDAAARNSLEGLVDRFQRPPYTWDDYCGISRLNRFEQATS